MNLKALITDTLIIGLSAALLWHFWNIWRYGQLLVGEPNITIRSLETAGLLLIFAFGVIKLISDLKGRREREHLSAKVRQLRRKKGWAQEDMAREMDVSLSTVQRWEKQGAKPTRLARRELARFFQEAGISGE